MQSKANAGFVYRIQVREKGVLVHDDIARNLIPDEGLAYLQRAALLAGVQHSEWFMAAFTNNYTPGPGDTAANFPIAAGEFTAYEGSSRPQVVLNEIAAGAVGNLVSPIVMRATEAVTLYGGFITSASGKGASSGVLISAVRFDSPKPMSAGAEITITAVQQLIN